MSTFADQMVAKYEALLLANAGLTSINVDGQVVSFADLEAKYQQWKSMAARESGRRPRAAQIKLSGF